MKLLALLILLFDGVSSFAIADGGYNNFKVAVYARAYEVQKMDSLQWLNQVWDTLSHQVHIDKIYLETHRDRILVDATTLEAAKKFFRSKGLKVAGGITYTINERNRYETFCYTNPENRTQVREIAEYTAKHFDEVILDDFFFTNCKCDLCIKAKGNQSWTQYRLRLLTNAARELVIDPAKRVNPKVKIVIKFPNWYEHFQGLGFNLQEEPKLFDGIYTGTETRDPEHTGQHLQQYESYAIFRYFESVAPGKNGGGWVDPGGLWYLDRYAEQLWLTLFANAPEITLFDFRQLQRPLRPSDRAAWQGSHTSFDYDTMVKPRLTSGGTTMVASTIARAAGYAFEQIDSVLGFLGSPVGIKSYRPYNSLGEDYLDNFLGMVGIPVEIVPEFPTGASMVLLTESAKYDPAIVKEIEGQLSAGKNVMITSGLLKALQGKGIEDIVELRYTDRKVPARKFMIGGQQECELKEPIIFPHIDYLTNDSWEDISCLASGTGSPLLHQARYATGSLFVLTIPDNFGDLYKLPAEVLNRIREVLSQEMPVRIEGPSQVSLFVYDNGTYVVESFLPESAVVKIISRKNARVIEDVSTGKKYLGTAAESPPIWGRLREATTRFEVTLDPHSYIVFRAE